jgi:hypothetical protein
MQLSVITFHLPSLLVPVEKASSSRNPEARRIYSKDILYLCQWEATFDKKKIKDWSK